MQPIRTARLMLEPLSVAHAPAMFDLLRDPAIYTYLDFGPPPSLEHLVSVYRQLETRTSPDGSEQWLNWIVCAPAPIGVVQATVRGEVAEVAYLLAPMSWGRGYAFEAVSAMLTALSPLRRYYAKVDVANERSIRLLQRLGFTEVADVQPSSGERVFERVGEPWPARS